jgi:hypothetical protein
MRVSRKWFLAGAVGLGLALGAVAPRVGHACGGLFCSSATPVNQAAERIIFSFDRKAKQVTAVVEILYDGPSEKFAWVLPVPGTPKVDVSSSAIFDRLQQITNPTFQIQRTWKGTCERGNNGNGSSGAPPSSPQPGATGGGDSKGVTVLASGAVGPYVYDTIMVDPTASDPAMVAIQWLQANQYEVTAMTGEVLRPYLRDNLNLIAFRLNKAKGKTTGSIRPIKLTYTTDHPMIPIRPTAVAANDDMGVLAFVLADARAVPINYATLELNEAALDWFNPATSYNSVVVAAADEAPGGQGFVTEFANPTTGGSIANGIYPEAGSVDNFRRVADTLTPAALVIDVIERFSTTMPGGLMGPFAGRPVAGGRVALDGVTDVLADPMTGIVLPPDVSVETIVASPRCYLTPPSMPTFYCEGKQAPSPAQMVDLTAFNKVEFLKKVEALVIQPLEKTAQLFVAQPFLTRLYTTLSAREMTLDPTFDINAELEAQVVSNQHTLPLTYTKGCSGDVTGDWEANFGDYIVRGTGTTWPVKAGVTMVPFNRRVTQLSARGQGEILKNNSLAIAAALGGAQPMPGGMPGGTPDGGAPGAVTPPRADVNGGCTMVPTPSAAAPWVLALPALLAFRRRRR